MLKPTSNGDTSNKSAKTSPRSRRSRKEDYEVNENRECLVIILSFHSNKIIKIIQYYH